MNQIEKALSDYLGEMCGMRLKPHALTGLAEAAIAAMQPAPQEPVAWMYGRDDGSRDLLLDCNGEYARNLLELGATETPLYAHPPAAPDTVTLDRALVALLAVVNATRAYLPPDGIDAQECLNRILAVTDNPEINPIIAQLTEALIGGRVLNAHDVWKAGSAALGSAKI